jgi:hypothetical protein
MCVVVVLPVVITQNLRREGCVWHSTIVERKSQVKLEESDNII